MINNSWTKKPVALRLAGIRGKWLGKRLELLLNECWHVVTAHQAGLQEECALSAVSEESHT